MSSKNQHVVPHDGGWAVRGEGSDRVTAVYPTKQEALDRGRQIAQNQGSELLIHGLDGKIQSRDSHGKDLYPPKG